MRRNKESTITRGHKVKIMRESININKINDLLCVLSLPAYWRGDY
jgi:hypothetical protein